jgi:hypothetical protein
VTAFTLQWDGGHGEAAGDFWHGYRFGLRRRLRRREAARRPHAGVAAREYGAGAQLGSCFGLPGAPSCVIAPRLLRSLLFLC